MPKTPQFLTPRGTPKYKRTDSLVHDDFMKSDDFTEAYSHLDDNAFQSYQQSFTASEAAASKRVAGVPPNIQRDSAPPKYEEGGEGANGQINAYDLTPPTVQRYVDPPNMQREVYTFGGDPKAALAPPIVHKSSKRHTAWLVILSILVLVFAILSSISLVRVSNQQSEINSLKKDGGFLVSSPDSDSSSRDVDVSSSSDNSQEEFSFKLTTDLSSASAGEEKLSVVTTLMAGHGYWIRKNSMVAARSDFQAIYITEKDEHVAVDNTDLTGKVLLVGGHDDRGNHLRNVITYDPILDRFEDLVEDMPQERAKFASVLYRAHVVVIGGYENYDQEDLKQPEAGMLLFDLEVGGWLTNSETQMNYARSDFCAAVVNDVIYVAGGAGQDRRPLDSIEAYDWDNDKWTVVGTMPTARADVSCAALNGKLYIAGGNEGGDLEEAFQAELLEFDPATQKVIKKAPLKHPRADAQMVAMPNGHLIIMGGEYHYKGLRGQIAMNFVEEWIPQQDVWIERPPLSEARFRYGAAIVKGGLMLFGGHPTCTTGWPDSCYPDALRTVEAFYDVPHPDVFVLAPPNPGANANPLLELDSNIVLKDEPNPEAGFVYAGSLGDGSGYWIPKDPMDVALSDFGLEPLSEDQYLIFGGLNNQGVVVGSVYKGHNVLQKYEVLPKMPEPRYRHAHARLGERVFVIGGLNSTKDDAKPKAEVLEFNVGSGKWVPFGAQLNVPRVDACAVAIGDSIYVVGGYDEKYNTLDSVEKFTPGSGAKWEVLGAKMPQSRGDVRCVAFLEELWVVGGYHPEDDTWGPEGFRRDVEVFNPVTEKWWLAASMPEAIGDSMVVALPKGAGIIVAGGEVNEVKKVKNDDKEGDGEEKEVKVKVGMHQVYQYLPEHDKWVERAPLPQGRFRGAAMYLQGAVQVLGGHATCREENWEDDCHLGAFKSHVAYYDLNTPDIFVYVRKG